MVGYDFWLNFVSYFTNSFDFFCYWNSKRYDFSCTIQFPFKHFWSIVKNHKDFFTCPIIYITCAVNSTSRFTCIMKMLSNFIVFVISVFIFRSFLSKYDKFVDYMIYAPFLLMVSFSFFKINFIHCVFFYGFTKYFHAIFTSA